VGDERCADALATRRERDDRQSECHAFVLALRQLKEVAADWRAGV